MRTFRAGACLAGMALAALLMASACQNAGRGANTVQNENVQSYSRDGYLGITDANPNLPSNPSYHTYTDDMRTMNSVIGQIAGVQDSSTTFNGAVASVKLYVPQTASDAELETIRETAQAQLNAAMPRYIVKVSVARR